MKLSELKTGERGVIVKVTGHGGFRKRIVHPGGQSDRFTPAGGPGTPDLRADGVGGLLVGPV